MEQGQTDINENEIWPAWVSSPLANQFREQIASHPTVNNAFLFRCCLYGLVAFGCFSQAVYNFFRALWRGEWPFLVLLLLVHTPLFASLLREHLAGKRRRAKKEDDQKPLLPNVKPFNNPYLSLARVFPAGVEQLPETNNGTSQPRFFGWERFSGFRFGGTDGSYFRISLWEVVLLPRKPPTIAQRFHSTFRVFVQFSFVWLTLLIAAYGVSVVGISRSDVLCAFWLACVYIAHGVSVVGNPSFFIETPGVKDQKESPRWEIVFDSHVVSASDVLARLGRYLPEKRDENV